MSNFPGDPRRLPAGVVEKKRKDKFALRIGDSVNNLRNQIDQTNNNSNEEPSIQPIYQQQIPSFNLLNQVWNRPPGNTSAEGQINMTNENRPNIFTQSTSVNNPLINSSNSQPSNLSFVTSNNLRKLREQQRESTQNQGQIVRPTSANPIIPQVHRPQTIRTQDSSTSPAMEAEQVQTQPNVWGHLIQASIHRARNINQTSPAPSTNTAHQNSIEEDEQSIGKPRKKPTTLFQIKQEKSQDISNSSLSEPAEKPKPLLVPQSVVKPEVREKNEPEPQKLSEPNNLQLFDDFVREQIKNDATTSIYFIIDRLDKTLPSYEPKWKDFFPKDTKVCELKEYFPYLASIKKWYRKIHSILFNCSEILLTIEKRSIEKAQAKLLQLKKSGGEAKKVLNLSKLNQKTWNLIIQQTNSIPPIFSAYMQNNRHFTFSYPDQGLVAVCQSISQNYVILLSKAQQMLLFYPKFLSQQKSDPKDEVKVDCLLLQKLVLECGNLQLLRERIRKMKSMLLKNGKQLVPSTVDEKLFESLKKEWTIIILLRRIESMLTLRRKIRNNWRIK